MSSISYAATAFYFRIQELWNRWFWEDNEWKMRMAYDDHHDLSIVRY